MARKIKPERQVAEPFSSATLVHPKTQTRQECFVSSGDTIDLDSAVNDVTQGDDQADEGYQTNHDNKERNRNANSKDHHVTDTSSDTVSPEPGRGLQVLGRGVKQLVQTVQTLRQLGVEDLVVPLPKIVVVGDQSTGKSSLIEGISEIKVPRNTGTCTRCPLEINLLANDKLSSSWNCTITLLRKFAHNRSLPERATKARRLGPWQAQAMPEKFHFASISHKSEVEEVLERAQLATLNIGNSYELYKPGNQLPRDNEKVKFSPNVIQIDISGPELPNLSFFDLPGVINVSEVADEEYLVDLVKNLVKDYVEKPDCINLLAIPMTDDPANSSASRVIREVKGAEQRTVGGESFLNVNSYLQQLTSKFVVITKPDRFQKGESFEQWEQILDGSRFRLGFGYFVVKNNPDTRVDHMTARAEEESFFDLEEPWSSTLKAHADRFGTHLLQSALSQKLTAQIRTSLPHIKEQIERKAATIEEEFRELPEPLGGNLPALLYGDLLKFEAELGRHIDGGSNNGPFQRNARAVGKEFRKDLEVSKPVVVIATPPMPSRNQQMSRESPFGEMAGTPTPIRNRVPITIDSDNDDDETHQPASPMAQRSIKRKHNQSAQPTPRKIARTLSGIPASRSGEFDSKNFTLEEIRGILEDGYISLPGEIDPQATEKLILLGISHWERPLNKFMTNVGELCKNLIYDQVTTVFAHRQNTQFYTELSDICNAFLTRSLAEQIEIVKQVLKWEQKPKALNDEAIDVAKNRALEYLREKRREHLAKVWLANQEARSGKATTSPNLNDKVAKVTHEQLGVDPFSLEIKAMASVRGYYEVAFNRFADVVCSSVDGELFMKCRNSLVKEIKQHFRATEPGADERLSILLAANPEDEQRRARLKREIETLQKAQEHLEGLTEDEQ